MEKEKMNRKPLIIAACVLVVLVVVVGVLLGTRQQQAQPGAKTISVTILHGEDVRRTCSIQTDAEYLRGALEEQTPPLIAGEESELGLFVTGVDGRKADDSRQEWWCFTKSGETLFTGVDETPIADGDAFEITLITGY